MTVQVEFWQLVTLLVAFFSFVGAVGKLLLNQIDKRLDERFTAQEEVRKGAQKIWQKAFDDHMAAERRETEALHQLEKDFLRFQGDLPLHYIRREDYIRNQTIIEAKLDGLALKLENIQLKGNRHD
jgi:hypothetical protein